ncbi:hypothetical protein ASC74_17175 [Pseudomonas sp. Root329]|nr:hypothetical protein ASC74_17175 [Pseudomonas sp. Root329]
MSRGKGLQLRRRFPAKRGALHELVPCKLESSNRNVALSIQQLAVAAELLVNRALDAIDPPEGAPAVQPTTQY